MTSNFQLYKKIFQNVYHSFARIQQTKERNPEFIPLIDKIQDWFLNRPHELYGMFKFVMETQDPYLFIDSLGSLINYEILDDGGITFQYRRYFLNTGFKYDDFDEIEMHIKNNGPKENWKQDVHPLMEGMYYVVLDKIPENKDCEIVLIRSDDNCIRTPEQLIKLMDQALELQEAAKKRREEFDKEMEGFDSNDET